MIAPILLAAGIAFAGSPAEDPQTATIRSMRDTGIAMLELVASTGEDDLVARGSDVFDWSECPPATAAEVALRVVPAYAPAVPEKDGWGHAFEYCLGRAGTEQGQYIIGIRSPGRDDQYEGTVYKAGSFSPADADRDVVWLDGKFITWPARQ